MRAFDVQARALSILKKHCRVDWNGDHGKRICVSPKVPPSVHWAAVMLLGFKRWSRRAVARVEAEYAPDGPRGQQIIQEWSAMKCADGGASRKRTHEVALKDDAA